MPRPLNIAIVEDNPHEVLLMKEFLNDSGMSYRLRILDDGESAIQYIDEILARPESIPDLMLLDLNLPKRNGHEVLKELRSHSQLDNLTVVILTTSENPEDERQALANGANCYLTKPPSFENLWYVLEVIETAWLNIAAIGEKKHLRGDADSSPRRAEDADFGSAAAAEKQPEQNTILLIEDNPVDALLIQELLSINAGEKYTLNTANDLASAQKVLKTRTFDLIITDLGLPDAKKLEVLDGLKDYSREIPIVILSGLDDEAAAREALSRGAQDYLIKGQIDAMNLMRSIRYAMIRFQSDNVARSQIKAERELLQQLLEGTPVSIARFDKNFGLLSSNSSFQSNFCSAKNGGKSIKALLQGIDNKLWDRVAGDGTPFTLEGVALSTGEHGERSHYDVFVWATPARDKSIDGGIFMAIDAAGRMTNDRHQQEFIAELAHDLKNPLIGANKLLEYMIQHGPEKLDEPHKGLLSEIHKSNDSLLAMLRDVLDVYRFDTGVVELVKEPIDFELISGKAVAAVIPMARAHRISLQVHVNEQLAPLKGDPMAIQRLIANLLHNAVKFSKPGGEVSLVVGGNSDQVLVSVSDNGAGISPTDQEYLFRRFGQGKSKYYKQGAGIGIGLYLCKKIAEAHNGSIQCSSRLGEGTTFDVMLPVEVMKVCA